MNITVIKPTPKNFDQSDSILSWRAPSDFNMNMSGDKNWKKTKQEKPHSCVGQFTKNSQH